MSPYRYFGDEKGLRLPGDGGLVRESVPVGVRNAVASWIDTHLNVRQASDAWRGVMLALDLDVSLFERGYERSNKNRFFDFLRKCEWWAFLDSCSATYYFVVRDEAEALDFRELLNSRLLRYHSAYLMDDEGRVYEPGAEPADQMIAEARAILRDERLGGPDHQFVLALEAYDKRPEFDAVGTISGSINAVEGLARLALDDPDVKLGPALKRIRSEHDLHRALTDSIANLYGYASQEGGRHGLTGRPEIDRPIAEFCLHQAAAAIVLIARLYGFGVVEGPQPAAGA